MEAVSNPPPGEGPKNLNDPELGSYLSLKEVASVPNVR